MLRVTPILLTEWGCIFGGGPYHATHGTNLENPLMTKMCYMLLAGLLAGCATMPTDNQMVPANTKSIVLAEVVTNMVYGGGKVILPSGVYQPDFQAKFWGEQGVFYRAPARLLFIVPVLSTPNDQRTAAALDANSSVTGGLFVPKSNTPGGAKAVWYEPLSAKKGTAPRVLSLENPVAFQSE